MRSLFRLQAALLLFVAAAPVAAQEGAGSPGRRVALTAGVGMSYAGLGVSGEVSVLRPSLSLVAGVGGIPGYGEAGVMAGVRFRPAGIHRKLYLQVSGGIFGESDDERGIYGPALLAGLAADRRSGLTFHIALGAGRSVDGSLNLALDLGIGRVWRGYAVASPRR